MLTVKPVDAGQSLQKPFRFSDSNGLFCCATYTMCHGRDKAIVFAFVYEIFL